MLQAIDDYKGKMWTGIEGTCKAQFYCGNTHDCMTEIIRKTKIVRDHQADCIQSIAGKKSTATTTKLSGLLGQKHM